jgi:hypothetical protein
MFVVIMTNNSHCQHHSIMTIINFLFRERAMFAVEQSLREPMLKLNHSGMKHQGKGKNDKNCGRHITMH